MKVSTNESAFMEQKLKTILSLISDLKSYKHYTLAVIISFCKIAKSHEHEDMVIF